MEAKLISGECKFCGQNHMIEGEGLSQEEINERATRNCTCAGARDYNRRIERREKIEEHVRTHFTEETQEAILEMIALVNGGEIESCSIKTPNGWTCKMEVDKDGYLEFHHKKIQSLKQSF